MDTILDFLNSLRQSQHWPLYQALLMGLCAGLPLAVIGVVVNREELYAAVREAFRLAGITNTAAAIDAGIGESLASKKLRGEKPMTLDFVATQSPALLSWLGLVLLDRFGMPPVAVTAARVMRRQARIHHLHKRGAA